MAFTTATATVLEFAVVMEEDNVQVLLSLRLWRGMPVSVTTTQRYKRFDDAGTSRGDKRGRKSSLSVAAGISQSVVGKSCALEGDSAVMLMPSDLKSSCRPLLIIYRVSM